MRNRKLLLIFKAILIVLLTTMIFVMPTQDNFRKWFRFVMLVVFVASFIYDLNVYKKRNG